MINEEIARKTLNMEVRAAKVTGKLILNLLKKLMKEAEKLGGLEKLINANGNEVKLKDMVKKGGAVVVGLALLVLAGGGGQGRAVAGQDARDNVLGGGGGPGP